MPTLEALHEIYEKFEQNYHNLSFLQMLLYLITPA